MATYGLLEQSEEDAIHKSRLLNVEEKPFRRIARRLLTPQSLISHPPTLPPTPPPDASSANELAAAAESTRHKQNAELAQFRQDILLDFAAFSSSLARMQFILTSNDLERTRYAAEKVRILSTAEDVRVSTASLRVELEEAQRTLALRKTWDELADKITANRMLRPRSDQHASLEKLNREIEELERESEVYKETWAERREQFGRIVKEGRELRRLIRDEKEEVERREGMDVGGEGEGEGDEEAATARGSAAGTPRPGTMTGGGGATPSHDGGETGAVSTALRPPAMMKVGRLSPSPQPQSEEDKDVPMVEQDNEQEQGEIADGSGDQKEEGEEDEEEEEGAVKEGDDDKMDVT